MKILLLILAMSLISCADDTAKVQNVVVMAYSYEFTPENIWRAYPIIYSEIDSEGEADILNSSSEREFQSFHHTIRKNILEKIVKLNGKESQDFRSHKSDSTKIDLYHGPIIRFKIRFRDGKINNLVIRDLEYDSTSTYFPHYELYKIVRRPNAKKESKSNYTLLNRKKTDFLRYSRTRDSTNNEFPPPPNPNAKIIYLNQ